MIFLVTASEKNPSVQCNAFAFFVHNLNLNERKLLGKSRKIGCTPILTLNISYCGKKS